MSPWTVTGDEIRRLQGRDIEFTTLLNELLGAATAGHMPPTALRLNVKTQAPDGGVDAAIDGGVPAIHDEFGPGSPHLLAVQGVSVGPHQAGPWAVRRTGGSCSEPRLRSLTHASCFAQGYGYRLCIADSLTPQQRQRWEGWLLDEARKINPQAPAPIVVSADILADWCSRHPGVVIRLRPYLAAVHDFRTWERMASAQSPTFVPVEIRQAASAAIRRFADLAQPARDPVLTVGGEAGVGKTRCVP